MPRYRVDMTFELVTDGSEVVETAARAAFQESLAHAQRLGDSAEGIHVSAVRLGLCTLLGEALGIGVQRRLPDEPQVQGLGVSAREVQEHGERRP